MKPWLLPGERRWLLCLGIHLWQKTACLFQRQQHGPFLSPGCVLGLYECAVFHMSSSTVFFCVTKPWPSDEYPSHTLPVVKKSQTNVYFKSTGKGKEIPNYLLQSYMFTSLYICIAVAKGAFCLQSSYLSSFEMVLSFSILMKNRDFRGNFAAYYAVVWWPNNVFCVYFHS